MSVKRIGTFSGSGEVFRASVSLGVAVYHLDVYQDFLEGMMQEGRYQIPGMKRVEGWVRGNRLPVGDALRLVTQEGYSLDFYVVNSSTGSIAASGFVDSAGKDV